MCVCVCVCLRATQTSRRQNPLRPTEEFRPETTRVDYGLESRTSRKIVPVHTHAGANAYGMTHEIHQYLRVVQVLANEAIRHLVVSGQ